MDKLRGDLKDATAVVLTNLYGWSVRGMPANRMAWSAASQLLDMPSGPSP